MKNLFRQQQWRLLYMERVPAELVSLQGQRLNGLLWKRNWHLSNTVKLLWYLIQAI